MKPFLDIVTTVSAGLMIGTELAVWVFVNPILNRLDDPSRTVAIRLFAQKLGAAMPVWYGLNFALLVAAAVLQRRAAGEPLLIAAGAIWAAVIVLTLIFLVPINNEIANLVARDGSAMTPDAFRRSHRIWDLRHRWRVGALGAALVCIAAALCSGS